MPFNSSSVRFTHARLPTIRINARTPNNALANLLTGHPVLCDLDDVEDLDRVPEQLTL